MINLFVNELTENWRKKKDKQTNEILNDRCETSQMPFHNSACLKMFDKFKWTFSLYEWSLSIWVIFLRKRKEIAKRPHNSAVPTQGFGISYLFSYEIPFIRPAFLHISMGPFLIKFRKSVLHSFDNKILLKVSFDVLLNWCVAREKLYNSCKSTKFHRNSTDRIISKVSRKVRYFVWKKIAESIILCDKHTKHVTSDSSHILLYRKSTRKHYFELNENIQKF